MRLIDADALTKQLEEMAGNEWNKSVGSSKGLEDAIDVIETMPTVERPHGEWKYLKELITDVRDADGRASQKGTCQYILNLMEVIERGR